MNARHDRSPAGPTAAPLRPRGGRPASPALIDVDGLRIAMTWLPLTGSILVDFLDIEPRRIGTVVMRESGPGFVAQPGHFDWLRYDEREARLLRAAARLREANTFIWRSKSYP